MSRLIGAGAFSVLVHGGLALAILTLARSSTVVPPRVLYVVLPALEAGEPPRGGRVVGAEGRARAAESERVGERAGRMRSAPALRTGLPAPSRGEPRDAARAAFEPARSAVGVSTPPSALPAPSRAETGPAMTPSGAVEAPREPDAELRVSKGQRPATALVPDDRESRHGQEPRAAEPAPRSVARPTALESIAESMPPSGAGARENRIGGGSSRVPLSASASHGVGGRRRVVDADDTSTDGRAERASPDAGFGTGLRGSGPGRELSGAGGAMGALPGPGEGVEGRASPRYSDNPRPAYPWRARVRGEQGVVLLSALVNEQGGVSDIRVMTSSGSPILDEAATSAVKAWRFQPGRRGTQAVASWVQVPIRFRLED